MKKADAGIWFLMFSLGAVVGMWGGEAIREASRTQKQPPPPARFAQTFEPPLEVGAEPTDANERVGWIERIVERRLTRALESDPDAKGGPFVDVLAVKLAGFVRRLIGIALGLAVTAAVVAFLWNHWPWIVAWVLGHIGLSWFAGRLGSKKGT